MLRRDGDDGARRIAPYTPARPAAVHGAWPKATPLFHNGRLFTLGISGMLSAFEPATGKLLWQTLPPKESPFYGAASSPVGYRNVVLAHPGNYGPLTAFDAATGVVRWATEGMGFFASPIVVELSGVRQAVTVLVDSIMGVSLASGEVRGVARATHAEVPFHRFCIATSSLLQAWRSEWSRFGPGEYTGVGPSTVCGKRRKFPRTSVLRL